MINGIKGWSLSLLFGILLNYTVQGQNAVKD